MAPTSSTRGPLAQIARDHKELLSAIDELHELGVDIDAFPKFVVVGDRSSGKSSILHAISGIDFPATGTEFSSSVLEVSLRTSNEATIVVEVKEEGSNTFVPVPGLKSRQTDSRAVNKILEQVKVFMERESLLASTPVTALRVKVGAPDFGHIAFVDLPGFSSDLSTDSNCSTDNAVPIAKGYMCKKNAIILIAVPADRIHERLAAVELCKLIDPTGERTLAIVTKTDLLPTDSPLHEQVFGIFHDDQNGFLPPEKWHVLPNPPRHGIYYNGTEALSAPQPQMPTAQIEKHFPQIPDYDQGFGPLIPKLSALYANRLHANLPHLLANGASMLKCKKRDLEQIERPGSTDSERVYYLCGIANKFQAIAQAATKGDYDHDYFHDDSCVPRTGDSRKLRDIIRTLSRAFVRVMKNKGAHCNVVCDEVSITHTTEPAELHESMVPWVNLFHVETPTKVSLSDIKPEFASASSVSQVPGSVSYRLSLDIFRDQCCKWYDIARRHVDLVTDAVRVFVTAALEHVFGGNKSGFDTMTADLVQLFFSQIATELSEKLEELVWHYQHGDMICADDEFRQRLVERQALRLSFHETTQVNGILEAVEMMATYYEMAMHTFIDNVMILAVEKCLVSKIPSLVHSIIASNLYPDAVSRLTGQLAAVDLSMSSLNTEIEALKAALSTCEKHKLQNPITFPLACQQQESSKADQSTPARHSSTASQLHVSTSTLSGSPRGHASLWSSGIGTTTTPTLSDDFVFQPVYSAKLCLTEPDCVHEGLHVRFVNICFMSAFHDFSPEELRVADYSHGVQQDAATAK